MAGSADYAAGAVELREDAPLKAGGGGDAGGAWCAGGAAGPRLIVACFAALSAAITLALFTQIYSGDYEVVPHGGVASDAAACSGAGTDALKAGGRALDAALAAALCLAVTAPHLTSLDASGSLLHWDYRQMRTSDPTLVEWGWSGAGEATATATAATAGERPPRLLAALAALHAAHGALPWRTLLQPAIDLASKGFVVSESLAAALAARGAPGAPGSLPGARRAAPRLAAYLRALQRNTSAELSAAWGSAGMRRASAAAGAAGAWRVFAGGAGAGAVRRALAAALAPPPRDAQDAADRALAALREEAAAGGAWPPATGGVATPLAIIDSFDAYVALVTGLSEPFGSGAAGEVQGEAEGEGAAGWRPDAPAAPLDLAPAILLDGHVCGTRYVVGGATAAALAQALAALAAGGGGGGVERARLQVLRGGAVLAEPARGAAAVNLVRQRADALLSHADSRAGGLASRY